METCLFKAGYGKGNQMLCKMYVDLCLHTSKDVSCLLCRLVPIPATPRLITRNQEVKCAIFVVQSIETA